jgi:hypothetical protein
MSTQNPNVSLQSHKQIVLDAPSSGASVGVSGSAVFAGFGYGDVYLLINITGVVPVGSSIQFKLTPVDPLDGVTPIGGVSQTGPILVAPGGSLVRLSTTESDTVLVQWTVVNAGGPVTLINVTLIGKSAGTRNEAVIVPGIPSGVTQGTVLGFVEPNNAGGPFIDVRSTPYVEPAAAGQRSLASTNANDTALGTGARKVRISYYDNTLSTLKFEDVTLEANAAGVGDSISAPVAGIQTLIDAGAAFSPSYVGRSITIAGSAFPVNNGTFLITAVGGPTTISYANAAGVVEAVFAGTWAIVGVNTVATDIRFIESMIVIETGATGWNAGVIQLWTMPGGAGTEIGRIQDGVGSGIASNRDRLPNVPAQGDNRTFWTHHYVRTGFQAVIILMTAGLKGNQSGQFYVRARNPTLGISPDVQIVPTLRVGAPGQNSILAQLAIPVAIEGPAIVTMFASQDGGGGNRFHAGFSFSEQRV